MDEAIEVLEGPKTEKFDPTTRVKGRLLGDNVEGWITLLDNTVAPWSPFYKVVKPQKFLEASAEGSAEVRDLVAGETVELLDGPNLVGEGDAARLSIEVRAEKDDATGWCTLRDA